MIGVKQSAENCTHDTKVVTVKQRHANEISYGLLDIWLLLRRY